MAAVVMIFFINPMIAAMRKQIRTLDYRSGQHYMTVCVPNKYLVARTGQ